jgi:diguanylate cyclase (GGDEF)-like protein
VFRKLIIRLGLLWGTLALSLFSILFSVLLTIVISQFTGDGVSPAGIWTAVLVPAIIAPLFCMFFLPLLIQLDAAENRLRELSRRDSLTGIYNRSFFIELAERELIRTLRYGDIFSIAILDVDNFKLVNDTYGHLAGDKVLQVLSEICLQNLRQSDTIARFGGDEFVILFPYADKLHVTECLERIRRIVALTPVDYDGQTIHFTVSAGSTAYHNSYTDLDFILQQADKALYQAKESGKDRIILV